MLGIWHVGDWMKYIFFSTYLRLGGSWKSNHLLDLAFIIIASSLWHFMFKCTSLYVDFKALISMLFFFVMSMLCDKIDLCISSCFDLEMNVQ